MAEDLVKNTIYEDIPVTVGLAASSINTLRDGVLWEGEKETYFKFTPTDILGSSIKLTGTTITNATVAVYTVGEDEVRRFIAEAKTNAAGAYTIKLPHALAGEKIVYEITDKASNVFEKVVDVPKSDTLPALVASSKVGSVKNATKITAVPTKNTMNQLYVVKGDTTPVKVAGDPLPVEAVRLSTTDIDMTNYSHITVYEVSPTGKIIKAKTLTGRALKKAL